MNISLLLREDLSGIDLPQCCSLRVPSSLVNCSTAEFTLEGAMDPAVVAVADVVGLERFAGGACRCRRG